MPRVSFLYPMASADAEELRRTHRVSRCRLKAAILDSTAVESPEGEEGRQDDPLNVKDWPYNRGVPGSGPESS